MIKTIVRTNIYNWSQQRTNVCAYIPYQFLTFHVTIVTQKPFIEGLWWSSCWLIRQVYLHKCSQVHSELVLKVMEYNEMKCNTWCNCLYRMVLLLEVLLWLIMEVSLRLLLGVEYGSHSNKSFWIVLGKKENVINLVAWYLNWIEWSRFVERMEVTSKNKCPVSYVTSILRQDNYIVWKVISLKPLSLLPYKET